MMHRRRRYATLVIVAAAALALPAAASDTVTDPRAPTAADARIRERVLNRLLGQVAIHPVALEVAVAEGTVRLTGTVASVGEKERVERLVQGIVGVRSVTNDLAVRPTDRSEISIEQEVRRLLEKRASLRDRGLGVSAEGTVVTLSGTVERGIHRLEAGEIAAGVPGVTRVVNELRVATEDTLTSEAIRERVLSVLRNPLTFGVIRDLDVEVDRGTVVLRGLAERDADRREAERLALTVPGVSGVVNRIRLPGS